MITRGQLYTLIKDSLLDEEHITYNKAKTVQNLIDKMAELPACWPDGEPKAQTIKLDSDLVRKQDVFKILNEFIAEDPKKKDKTVIYSILQHKIYNAV